MHRYIAIDVGAESGRVIVASIDGGRLDLEEIHRFANGPVQVNQGLYLGCAAPTGMRSSRVWAKRRLPMALLCGRLPWIPGALTTRCLIAGGTWSPIRVVTVTHARPASWSSA